ncbi:Nn.00g096210.m01.CDS01 [Neocucurbitaria sp. VM-36]
MASQAIHILGLGNLGKLLAHSLRKSHPDIPITLLFHRPGLVDEWDKAGRSIEVVRDGVPDRQSGFLHEDVSRSRGDIQNLIVATKTYSTVDALQPVSSRLGPLSTLLFLQNGIGTVDEVTSRIFTRPSSRPNYLAGIVNHGVYATSAFSSVHAGVANAVIGPVSSHNPTEAGPPDMLTTTHMARLIADCTVLSVSLVSAPELLLVQLQKLAINAIINPLTVIFDCYNGELFMDPAVCTLIEQLIVEISVVIQSIISSQIQLFNKNVLTGFSPENLHKVVLAVGEKTAKNISSMRQDRRAGRRTEIDYINGYIVTRGANHNIPCPLNTRVVELVQQERRVSPDQIDEIFRN